MCDRSKAWVLLIGLLAAVCSGGLSAAAEWKPSEFTAKFDSGELPELVKGSAENLAVAQARYEFMRARHEFLIAYAEYYARFLMGSFHQTQAAVDRMTKAAKLLGDDADALTLLAWAQHKVWRDTAAYASASRAMSLDKENLDAQIIAGVSRREMASGQAGDKRERSAAAADREKAQQWYDEAQRLIDEVLKHENPPPLAYKAAGRIVVYKIQDGMGRSTAEIPAEDRALAASYFRKYVELAAPTRLSYRWRRGAAIMVNWLSGKEVIPMGEFVTEKLCWQRVATLCKQPGAQFMPPGRFWGFGCLESLLRVCEMRGFQIDELSLDFNGRAIVRTAEKLSAEARARLESPRQAPDAGGRVNKWDCVGIKDHGEKAVIELQWHEKFEAPKPGFGLIDREAIHRDGLNYLQLLNNAGDVPLEDLSSVLAQKAEELKIADFKVTADTKTVYSLFDLRRLSFQGTCDYFVLRKLMLALVKSNHLIIGMDAKIGGAKMGGLISGVPPPMTFSITLSAVELFKPPMKLPISP